MVYTIKGSSRVMNEINIASISPNMEELFNHPIITKNCRRNGSNEYNLDKK